MGRHFIEENEYMSPIRVPIEGILDAENQQSYRTVGQAKLEEDKRFQCLLIPEVCLQKRIKIIAQEILQQNEGKSRLDLLVVLNGAFMFAADLGRELFVQRNLDIYFHYIKVSTYNTEIKLAGESSRKVKIKFEPEDIAGRDIIIVEDIIDQGFTMNALRDYLLNTMQAKSVEICTLLLKYLDQPTSVVIAERKKLNPRYVGFKVPDKWVAGYGIDAGNDFRYLPFIIDVNEEEYLN
jgi:hypoxanthine phosphoribosyltransferase